MGTWNAITGVVRAELTGAAPEDSLAALSARNIEVRDIQKVNALTCCFSFSRNHIKAVMDICKKRGDILKIRNQSGIYWMIKRVVSRPVLLVGGLLLIVLTLWIPGRVLFVQVEGNTNIPARRILAAAEECGIVIGASRREVRSEKVKNALLLAVPELQWAGVNTSGCTATISVREKKESEDQEKQGSVRSILAARDGYILSCTATAGNLLVRPGDSVRKGQVLISAYTDCGLCIRAECAEGEIMGQTSRSIEAVMPSQYIKKGKPGQVKRRISLLVRKKRIFLWKDSGIWEGSCGRMYEEYYITLPGGFRLPIAISLETYQVCETDADCISEEHGSTELKEFAQTYLLQHMAAGKVLSGVQTVVREDGLDRLKGQYACVEMIGIARQEKIGDRNGKDG